MAGPSKVEFPGQKKQRVRMRGTKQANEATENRIKRELAQLLEDPAEKLPQMLWKGRLRWGRVDPVTKTLNELNKIIKRKNDVRWLGKRMMSKRGDPVAKAFAGSLHAAHDEDFKMVGNFNSGSFGGASFIRRGDGKQGYLAGLQNHSHLTLRMLPWEDHAKRGMYFFTWKGGFVCTGPKPSPPDEWLEDVLARSRFNFSKDDDIPLPVWVTEGLDPKSVLEFEPSSKGYVRFSFKHGPIAAIGLDTLDDATKKESSFIHHLALSMLPPFLPSILTIEANWAPKGWPEGRPLPEASAEGIDKIIDAWQGLTMNEGLIGMAVRRAVLDAIDEGLLLGENWIEGQDLGEIKAGLEEHPGSQDERQLAAHMLLASMEEGPTEEFGMRINPRGDISERKGQALEIMNGTSCGNILGTMWEKWGMAGLAGLGIEGVEAEEIWKKQNRKPQPFGTFLKSLDSARSQARRVARFPTRIGDLDGAVGKVHDLVLQGLLEGMGKAERVATARHPSIDEAAASWAWLLAAGRSAGQDWHFEANARDRAGAWLSATKSLLACGEALLEDDNDALEQAQRSWQEALDALKVVTGEAN
jgi:hypothetical protein|tara:strand:+ start:2544 stop:4298 length:1755 start_codon:yes stop_codon:yes gene_type:complete